MNQVRFNDFIIQERERRRLQREIECERTQFKELDALNDRFTKLSHQAETIINSISEEKQIASELVYFGKQYQEYIVIPQGKIKSYKEVF